MLTRRRNITKAKMKKLLSNVGNHLKKQFNYILAHEWMSWLFVVLGAFLISFIAYLIFNSPWRVGNPELNLYQPGVSRTEVNNIASKGRAFVNSLDYTGLYVTGWILFIALLVLTIILLARRKMKWRYAFLILFAISTIAKIVYTNATDNIFTRQYDVWSSSYYGHYSITMHIFENGFKLPELSSTGKTLADRLSNSYQMYHPKFAHYTYAIVMKINSILFIGANSRADYTLYESIRIFTCALTIINVYISYLIFKEILRTTRGVFIGTAFVALAPALIRLSAGSNNDPMLYFFMFLAILFAIRFYKRNGWINIIGCALSIGISMGSKISGALIAIPIGALFVYKFIRIFIENKGQDLKKPLLQIFGYYIVFAIICMPLGLFWPLYNYKNYGQPLSYVWHNLNHLLLINEPSAREGVEVYSYASMYLFFSFRTFFVSMFHVGFYNAKTAPIIDFNMYTNAFKTSIFGEYSYQSGALFFCVLLYGTAFIIAFGCLGIGLYYILKGIIKKQYDIPILLSMPMLIYLSYVFIKSKDAFAYILAILAFAVLAFEAFYVIKNYKKMHDNYLIIFFMMLIFLTFMISFFDFQVQYPYTCTSDFRYIVTLLVPGGYVIARLFEKQKDNKNFYIPAIIVLAIYFFGGIGLNMVI